MPSFMLSYIFSLIDYITYIVRTTIKLKFDVFCLGYQDEIFFQTFVVIYFKLSFEDQCEPMKSFARSQKLILNAPYPKLCKNELHLHKLVCLMRLII
ncbi:hypothetical protein DhcVS_645 [Dehalococcoides mccartyi VS]|uniref:Uncharacterized protein n=1 Tax=Dehalococcoides mccartyi (strain VS) TaxID=311424 RepID=D2BHI5_DEHMV|nr:hypothetical protein DhcVS_645 [Dehalococcoides mccartyi VS]